MASFGSWRFWVIVALALGTLACANRAERRERKEEAREERRERREAAREAARERAEQRRAEREASGTPPPLSARERREAARAERRQRAEARRSPREEAPAEEPQPTPAVQTAAQTAAAPATLTPTSTAATPDAPSRVIFMRVSKQASNTNALLFDVSEAGEPKLIGNVGPASKISYSLKPGLYTFMVLGDTAEFMQATIIGGRTYYALVIPRGGATRFSVEPIRHSELGGKEFAGWDRGTKMTTGASAPYDAAAAAEKRVRYWQEWSKKSETQRAELTLNPEDGR